MSLYRARARPVRQPESTGVLHWLNALVSGACTEQEFLITLRRLDVDDPYIAWEVLGLTEQHFRRQRISREVYLALKGKFEHHLRAFRHDETSQCQSRPEVNLRVGRADPVEAVSGLRAPLAAGDTLAGRYRILAMLGRNELGPLFEAADEQAPDGSGTRHCVGVQVLEKAAPERQLLQRICSLQGLSHPGISRVYDVEVDHGTLFMTMELLAGVSLRHLMGQGNGERLVPPVARAIVRTVASALEYAHAHQVFHGDVSPENIFISDTGEIHLQGFDILGNVAAASAERDRHAFAWLAYRVLSRTRGPLHAPDCLSREQWHVLRDELLGRPARSGRDVLAMFAEDSGSYARRIPLLQALSPARLANRNLGGWAAAGLLTMIIAAGVLFVSPPAESNGDAGRAFASEDQASSLLGHEGLQALHPSTPTNSF